VKDFVYGSRLNPNLETLSALDPRKVQYRRDKAEQMLLALLNSMEIAPLGLGEGPVNLVLEQLGVSEDRLEGCAELVAKDSEKMELVSVGGFHTRAELR
jgi:hypothetical protein